MSGGHENTQARVRIYLPTYRRPNLLPRAVASLRAQTMRDWVCELHNDDPADPFPAQLVRELDDDRIRLVTHERNLGTIATFNLFYQPTPEPFYGILEDDNTWAPDFLQTLHDTLVSFPEAVLAWCNQRIDREMPDGTLVETIETVNAPTSGTSSAQLIPWGHPRQIMGAHHANGAMLIRTKEGRSFNTPVIPCGAMEPFRERMFSHPLVYVPQALATFTVTQTTTRKNDRHTWGSALVVLAATYLNAGRFSDQALRDICAHFREQNPPMTNELIAASFVYPEIKALRKHISLRDWLKFGMNLLRHPIAWNQTLRARQMHPDWCELLERHTAVRFKESVSRPHLYFR